MDFHAEERQVLRLRVRAPEAERLDAAVSMHVAFHAQERQVSRLRVRAPEAERLGVAVSMHVAISLGNLSE